MFLLVIQVLYISSPAKGVYHMLKVFEYSISFKASETDSSGEIMCCFSPSDQTG